MTPVSETLSAIEKAMEGVKHSEWFMSPWHVEEDASAVRNTSDRSYICNASSDNFAAYIASCNPVAMRDVLALARKAEALQREVKSLQDYAAEKSNQYAEQLRENAELRRSLENLAGVASAVKSFCQDNTCGDYGSECPIQMGEWWEPSDEDALSRARALLGGTENAGN